MSPQGIMAKQEASAVICVERLRALGHHCADQRELERGLEAPKRLRDGQLVSNDSVVFLKGYEGNLQLTCTMHAILPDEMGLLYKLLTVSILEVILRIYLKGIFQTED